MPCGCAHTGRLRAIDRRAPTPSPGQRRATAILRRLIEARQIALMRRVAGAMAVRATDAEPVPDRSVQQGLDLLRIMLGELDDLSRAEGQALDDLTIDIVMQGLRDAERISPLIGSAPSTWSEQFRQRLPEITTSLRAELAQQYRDVTEGWLDELAREVSASVAAGEDRRQLGARLAQSADIAGGFAERRAEQATRTMIEMVSRERQQAAGVEEYIWRTVGDSDVRPDHREREGMRYRYDNPPPDGHPGTPWGCRCFAEPVLPEEFAVAAQALRPADFEHDRRGPAKAPPPEYAPTLKRSLVESYL